MRFYEELVKFIIGPKILVIGTFRFLRSNIISNLFGDLVRAFFELFGRKLLLKILFVTFLSKNGKYKIL